MWVGSERIPLCASANEESDSLVNNAPLTEPRVKLYVPREASFPIPLKYIDATRATRTSVDIMLEKNIDDY